MIGFVEIGFVEAAFEGKITQNWQFLSSCMAVSPRAFREFVTSFKENDLYTPSGVRITRALKNPTLKGRISDVTIQNLANRSLQKRLKSWDRRLGTMAMGVEIESMHGDVCCTRGG